YHVSPYVIHSNLHSFPTRRSSDLPATNSYIANDGEARVVLGAGYNGGNFKYRPIRASSFPTGSLSEYKQDIKVWEGNALDIINRDRNSTRLNSSHVKISYAVFCLK